MYPSINEYLQSIELSMETLKTLIHWVPIRKANGQPYFSSGNFAVVFRMQNRQTGAFMALKCFLRPETQRQNRLWFIERYLTKQYFPYLLPFTYLSNELWVDTRFGKTTEFDVVTMPWIEGQPLAEYVTERCRNDDRNALLQLAHRFDKLACWLISKPFAHGDVKPDNIIVDAHGLLTLIDYDGFYVPVLEGLSATEIGTLPYRHPQRTLAHYNHHLDDFSLLALSLELHALSVAPDLYQEADSLLLLPQTMQYPFHSSLWEQLRNLKSRSVSVRAALLEHALHMEAGPISALKQCLTPLKS